MNAKAALRLAGVLVPLVVFGVAAVATSPSSVHFGGMWPVGLAAGLVLIPPRTLAPYVAAGVGLLAALTFALGGYPLDVSLGYGLGCALEAYAVRQVLLADWSERFTLRDHRDLGRFVAACHAGAVVGALTFMAVSALTSFGTPWQVGLATFVTHLAAELVLLGLFSQTSHHLGEYGRTERWLAWANIAVTTTVAFIPVEMPVLAFLVLPGLGWVALRAPKREAIVQLITVGVIAGGLLGFAFLAGQFLLWRKLSDWGYVLLFTAGLCTVGVIASVLTNLDHGPFADPFLTNHLDPELRLLPLQGFLVVCATMTIAFAMAVGAQRWSATEAHAERARSDRLVESARGIAIIGTDEFGRINLFSPGAAQILGYSVEDVFGHSTRMFHSEAEIARQAAELGCRPEYLSVVRATVALPPGSAREVEYVRKDGSRCWLSTILSPIIGEDGAVTGYVATAEDVTDRRETRSALEAALSSERKAVARLTAVDQVKDQFVSSVSHELRTPITNIVGYLELLTDGVYGEPNEEQARAMSRIEMNSRRLLTLIDDLLTLSSMESLNQPREMVPVDLGEVLRRADEIVRPSVRNRDLRLDLDVPDSPWWSTATAASSSAWSSTWPPTR